MNRLKSMLVTLAMLLCTISASAHDFEVDGIYYNITDSEKLTVEVTYRGSDLNSNNAYTGSVVIPETVTYKSKTYSVTSIGDDAFFRCSNLTSVTIPNSVTSIGSSAFSGCSSLTSIIVDIDNSIYDSRDNCNAIIETATNTLHTGCKNTVIPNSVTIIGSSAYSGCSGLTSITIPNSVTSIGGSAFSSCSGLTSITIPNSVTTIGSSAFFRCSSLTSITIPNSVISIGERAFYNCSSLTSITIPNSVTTIGSSVFYGCN